jgi:cell division protein FtsA
MNARIGFPNEHLAGGHLEELAKPMYSTCIGLILKGYNDFENKQRQFEQNFIKLEAAGLMQQQPVADVPAGIPTEIVAQPETESPVQTRNRKTLKTFMDSIKTNLIEMFKEEDDTQL